MILTGKQIEKAVNWWGNVLFNPKFKTLGDQERNDPGSQPAATAEMMARAKNKPPTIEEIMRFKVELEKLIRGNQYIAQRGLHVDYGPGALLADAAEAAGITSMFPWKTHMVFQNGKVLVSYGYGAQYEEI